MERWDERVTRPVSPIFALAARSPVPARHSRRSELRLRTACVYYVASGEWRVVSQDRPLVSSPSNGSGTACAKCRARGFTDHRARPRQYATMHGMLSRRVRELSPCPLSFGPSNDAVRHLSPWGPSSLSNFLKRTSLGGLSADDFLSLFQLELNGYPARWRQLPLSPSSAQNTYRMWTRHLDPSLACPNVYVVGSHGPRVVSSAHASSPCL